MKETTEGTKDDEGCEGGPRRARAKLENGRNGVGRKCADIFFIDVCNCVKMRDLTFKKVGRKYVRFFARGIAVSEKITTFASQ